METALLRDFVVLAQYLNFTSASRSLSMSQSTLSRHIEELERTLGADLVTHEGKVALTPAGKALLEDADTLLSAEDRIVRRVREVRGMTTRALRIEEYPYSQLVMNLVTEAVGSAVSDGHPVATEFVPTKAGPSIEDAVRDGYFDLAIVVHLCDGEAEFAPQEGVSYLPLPNCASRLCFYLDKGNPLLEGVGREGIPLARMRDQRFILPLRPEFGNFRHDLSSLCAARGFEAQFVLKRTHSMTDLACIDMRGLVQVITEADVASPDSMFLRGDDRTVVTCSDACLAVPALVHRDPITDPALAEIIGRAALLAGGRQRA